MRRSLVFALTCLVGSLTSLATAGAGIDPCLLSAKDLQEVLGFEFDDDDTFNGLAECEYVSAESVEGGATLGIALSEATTKREAKAVYKDQRFVATDEETIDDVGNAAFYTGSLGDVVTFRKGKVVVSLTLLVFAEELEPHRDEAIELAQIAADSL